MQVEREPEKPSDNPSNDYSTPGSNGKAAEFEPVTNSVNLNSNSVSANDRVQELLEEKNQRRLDFFGRIVDQYGQPVVNAEVTGNLQVISGLSDNCAQKQFITRSDRDGLFQFTGVTGWQLGIIVKKSGYIVDQSGEAYRPPTGGGSSTPENRAVFQVWKAQGADTLISRTADAVIPHDGSEARFDLATLEKNEAGDLKISLSRSPLEVRRSGQKFDWALTIEMERGGLIPENDPYPYNAPDNNYTSSTEIRVDASDSPWISNETKSFYVRDGEGHYGRMQINVFAALTPARIRIQTTFNPSGSRNLEPAQ